MQAQRDRISAIDGFNVERYGTIWCSGFSYAMYVLIPSSSLIRNVYLYLLILHFR